MKTKTSVVTLAIVLLLSTMFITPQTAFANRFTDQVRSQLRAIALLLGIDKDYELTHDPYVGKLEDDEATRLTLKLYRRNSYVIAGVCDEDCRDMDIELYDDDGNRVDFDMKSDDKPVVRVTPAWTAKFTLKISMPSCRRGVYCYYGIGVFGQ
ncbi:conserved hypothetical protein, secreted [Beggiatoa sp. PS]|nr:conserved hypothetical protein, secreted [Beggiatoa sp. PS]